MGGLCRPGRTMRLLTLPLVLMLAGCGGTVGGDDVPPKPTCDYDQVLELVAGPDACPDGYEWFAIWTRPSENNPLVTVADYRPVGEMLDEPWRLAGEACTQGGDEALAAASIWRCEGDFCSSYRYRVVEGGTVESNGVTCSLEDDGSVTVLLDRTTAEPGAEPVRERFLWKSGADDGERYPLPPGA